MSYLPARGAELIVTEYTIQSQSVASNADIVWDATTKRSTSNTTKHTINGSTITLEGQASFWLVASPDTTRALAADFFKLEFCQAGTPIINQSPIAWNSNSSTYNLLGITVVNVPTAGSVSLTLRNTHVGATFTANPAFTLQVWETH